MNLVKTRTTPKDMLYHLHLKNVNSITSLRTLCWPLCRGDVCESGESPISRKQTVKAPEEVTGSMETAKGQQSRPESPCAPSVRLWRWKYQTKRWNSNDINLHWPVNQSPRAHAATLALSATRPSKTSSR